MLQSLDNGRYTVRRALGQGGEGALFLATDHGAFDRTVVVKQLLDAPPGVGQAERHEARARFADEARTLAALRHPFIPKIFAYFTDGPSCFIVMEHIDGRDLEAGLSRADEAGRPVPGAPYPAADVARWGAALCGVLEYLHARRPQPVLHQDIKPANLVLDEHSGALFLVDFGTAHAHSGAPTGGYGTPGYAPPEQYRGQSQPRSDVYALAATLYHLASDDDPAQHPFQFPRLEALGGLGAALRPALAKDPAARPHAHDLRRSLEALAQPALARALAAPDGDTLYDELQVARWCERNWGRAAPWLSSRALPDQLERCWGSPALARRLRDAVARHPADDAAALDAALALLDPRGYGAVTPALAAGPDVVSFRPQQGALGPATLSVQNQGRRYVRARVLAPPWLSVSVPAGAQAAGSSLRSPSLGLAPGQSAALVLTGDPPRGAFRRGVGETLELHEEDASGHTTGALLASVTLRKQHAPLANLVLPLALLLLAVLAPLALNLLVPSWGGARQAQPFIPAGEFVNDASYPWPSHVGGTDYTPPPAPSQPYPQPPAPSQPYPPPAAASAAYPIFPAEATYQRARAQYAAKQWADLRRTLLLLTEQQHNYKDSAFLLKESYYHMGEIAFERGDWAAAERELRVVHGLDGSYLDTNVMLAQCYMHLADEALRQGRRDDALRHINQLDSLQPAFPELPRLRAALAAAQRWPSPTPYVP